MTLTDQIAADSALLVAASDFGELVTYRPASGAGPFTLAAMVMRTEPATRPETIHGVAARARVLVRNHADPAKGILLPSKLDRMDVMLRQGEAARACRVTEVLGGDAGVWTLEVTA